MEDGLTKVKLKLPENPYSPTVMAFDDNSSSDFTVPVVNLLKIMELEPVSSVASSPIQQLTFRHHGKPCTDSARIGVDSYHPRYTSAINADQDKVIFDTVSGHYTVRKANQQETSLKDDDDALMSAVVTDTGLLSPQQTDDSE